MTRDYDASGFRRIESPPRTCLRITEDKDITLPGIGEDVEQMLMELAREKQG